MIFIVCLFISCASTFYHRFTPDFAFTSISKSNRLCIIIQRHSLLVFLSRHRPVLNDDLLFLFFHSLVRRSHSRRSSLHINSCFTQMDVRLHCLYAVLACVRYAPSGLPGWRLNEGSIFNAEELGGIIFPCSAVPLSPLATSGRSSS